MFETVLLFLYHFLYFSLSLFLFLTLRLIVVLFRSFILLSLSENASPIFRGHSFQNRLFHSREFTSFVHFVYIMSKGKVKQAADPVHYNFFRINRQRFWSRIYLVFLCWHSVHCWNTFGKDATCSLHSDIQDASSFSW